MGVWDPPVHSSEVAVGPRGCVGGGGGARKQANHRHKLDTQAIESETRNCPPSYGYLETMGRVTLTWPYGREEVIRNPHAIERPSQ